VVETASLISNEAADLDELRAATNAAPFAEGFCGQVQELCRRVFIEERIVR
jgi:hypothetical protein